MITHVTVTYETVDGRIFNDEDEAYAYENNLIYRNSGFRFYNGGRRLIKDISLCYDKADFFTIDHSKEKENQMFMEMAILYFGWPFPHDILENKEVKRYRYDDDKSCWKPVSRKCHV